MKTLGILTVLKKRLSGIVVIGMSCFACSAVDAQLIDDFSGSLSGYTATVILDVNGGASNTSTWEITGGELGLTTTSYDEIEQHAYIRDGVNLAVGDELQLDVILPLSGTERNFGLYVGGTAPSFNVRQDYISIYGRAGSSVVRSRGFDGTTEYDNPTINATAEANRLFIARTDVNEFEAGFYIGAARNIITTRTPATANTADFIGFYADVREAGTAGFGDNLTIGIIPDEVPGDFNNDRVADANDIDLLSAQLGNPASVNPLMNLDSDNTITLADHNLYITTLVQDANGTGALVGDLNLDGDVDVSQILIVNGEVTNVGDASVLLANLGAEAGAGYADGDLNGDGDLDVSEISVGAGGVVNVGDASILLANLGQTTGGAPAASAVPEPGSMALLTIAGIGAFMRRRR